MSELCVTYLLMVFLQEVEFLFQAVQVTTERGDDLVMIRLGFLQSHAVPLHRLTHGTLRLPSRVQKHTVYDSCRHSTFSNVFLGSQTHLILKSSAASLALSISSMMRAFSRVFFLTCNKQKMKLLIKYTVHFFHYFINHKSNHHSESVVNF